jgi:hypothetical protein
MYFKGWYFISVVEHLPSMYKSLGLILSTEKKKIEVKNLMTLMEMLI